MPIDMEKVFDEEFIESSDRGVYSASRSGGVTGDGSLRSAKSSLGRAVELLREAGDLLPREDVSYPQVVGLMLHATNYVWSAVRDLGFAYGAGCARRSVAVEMMWTPSGRPRRGARR